MSSLESFFCLDAAADCYVNLRILLIEIRKATRVKVEASEVAKIASNLCSAGFFRRLRYNVEKQIYEPFHSESEINDMDWFEITPEGRAELDRLYIEETESGSVVSDQSKGKV
jgi:hypothetical protein